MDERTTDRGGSVEGDPRRRQAEVLDEMLRLLRVDAAIMETVREMVRVAGEEAARRPDVLFKTPHAEESGDGDLIGGQIISPTSVFGQLLDLVKAEKDFIQKIILRLLGL